MRFIELFRIWKNQRNKIRKLEKEILLLQSVSRLKTRQIRDLKTTQRLLLHNKTQVDIDKCGGIDK